MVFIKNERKIVWILSWRGQNKNNKKRIRKNRCVNEFNNIIGLFYINH